MAFSIFNCLLINVVISFYVIKSDRLVWRSEFVECRYIKANYSRRSEICITGERIYCCYNNALRNLDNKDRSEKHDHLFDLYDETHCCTFDQFLREHKIILNFIQILVWLNLIIFAILAASSVYLVRLSLKIIEEDNKSNIDMIRRIVSFRQRVRSKEPQTSRIKSELKST